MDSNPPLKDDNKDIHINNNDDAFEINFEGGLYDGRVYNEINGPDRLSEDSEADLEPRIINAVQMIQETLQTDVQVKEPWLLNSTSSQIILLGIFTVINFVIGAIVSIQANFYPVEGYEMEWTSTKFTFLYGINELVIFLAMPLYSKYIMQVSPTYLLNLSVLVTSTCCILFGLTGRRSDRNVFSFLSFTIRSVQAIGETGYMLAMFAIVAKKFPHKIGSIIISVGLATIFGIGIFLGKFVGLKLMQIGGYISPFAVLGSVLNMSVCLTLWAIPSPTIVADPPQERLLNKMLQVVNLPSVFIAILTLFGGACCFGFTFATMGSHLKQFHLTMTHLWLLYCLNIIVIIIVNPLWGLLCIRRNQTKIPSVLAAVFIIVAFSIHGPAPFLPFETTLWLCTLGVVLQGIGIGGEVVCSCIGSNKEAREKGFPDNAETKAIVLTLGCSVYALGMAVGSSVGTIMLMTLGYRMATLFIVIEHCLLALLNIAFVAWKRCSKKSSAKQAVDDTTLKNEEEPLIFEEMEAE